MSPKRGDRGFPVANICPSPNMEVVECLRVAPSFVCLLV